MSGGGNRATLAERQRRARELLARAREILDTPDPTPRSRTYIPARDSTYDNMTAEEIAAVETARQKEAHKKIADQYAHSKSDAFDDTAPELFFGGKAMHRRRGPFGW